MKKDRLNRIHNIKSRLRARLRKIEERIPEMIAEVGSEEFGPLGSEVIVRHYGLERHGKIRSFEYWPWGLSCLITTIICEKVTDISISNPGDIIRRIP